MAKIISSAEFDAEVLKSDVPVLVDFYAEWCGPCKMIAPALDELAADYQGRAKVIKIDVDRSGELAKSYGVRSVPMLLFFKGGRVAETQVGAVGKADLAAKINRLL
ncbi:MAG: thioredoxin [Defluviitaleaceae bacterium]|nr:thioredoxin [Defluviitaleaceae bacterium]MCL2835897.1 thioredoxin [Defluviitaleaceae bacterium]